MWAKIEAKVEVKVEVKGESQDPRFPREKHRQNTDQVGEKTPGVLC